MRRHGSPDQLICGKLLPINVPSLSGAWCVQRFNVIMAICIKYGKNIKNSYHCDELSARTVSPFQSGISVLQRNMFSTLRTRYIDANSYSCELQDSVDCPASHGLWCNLVLHGLRSDTFRDTKNSSKGKNVATESRCNFTFASPTPTLCKHRNNASKIKTRRSNHFLALFSLGWLPSLSSLALLLCPAP